MRWLSAVALAPVVGALGCAQIFGISNTSQLPAPPEATLQLKHVSIGASVVASMQDVTMQTATFYLPNVGDPMQLDATTGMQTAMDTWSAAIAAGNPTVAFTLPDLPMPWLHVWSLPARNITGSFVAYEHPSALPAPTATIEHMTVTLPSPAAAGESFVAQVIGPWMTGALVTPAVGATMLAEDVPYSKFTQLTQSLPTRIAATDAFIVLRYVGNDLTGVYQQPGFDQSDQMDTISGTMAAVPQDKMLSITYDATMLQNRFGAVRPGVGNLGLAWGIVAAPGYTVGDSNGVRLQGALIPAMSTMTMATYGNPFESLGWRSVLEFLAAETRSVTVGGVVTSASSLLESFVDPATASMMTLPSPLVQQISLDQHQLFTDNMTVMLDATLPHTVSLGTETTPAATVYTATVTELTVNAGALDRKIVASAISTSSTITLPPNVFQATHTYMITGTALVGGLPNAATGDLETASFPLTIGQTDSGIFTVVAP